MKHKLYYERDHDFQLIKKVMRKEETMKNKESKSVLSVDGLNLDLTGWYYIPRPDFIGIDGKPIIGRFNYEIVQLQALNPVSEELEKKLIDLVLDGRKPKEAKFMEYEGDNLIKEEVLLDFMFLSGKFGSLPSLTISFYRTPEKRVSC